VTKPVRVHGLRHTYATETIRNGAKINVLQRLLGHVSIVTTQRYIAHFELGELLEAVPTSLVAPR
jgi:site-specific recombinase XerD